MTNQDFLIKWGVYTLALLPVWFIESYFFGRIQVLGVAPMLIPLAVVAVGVLEGGLGGGGFGLGAGLLWDCVHFGPEGGMVVALAFIGAAAGIISRFALRQGLVGCLLCSLGALLLIDGGRILYRLFLEESLPALLQVAGLEIFISMLFVIPVYGLFLWVHRRVPESTHF